MNDRRSDTEEWREIRDEGAACVNNTSNFVIENANSAWRTSYDEISLRTFERTE